ncbi:nitroreductase/quinone reductase family protein [Streptomyces sp. MBT55]|uniref:nitroreductase/quinone reductase family protein n=1 Tax=Streptomyces sp. MBT55 TaxID=1488386 RepID=UPI001913A5AA|nr:nitroreductase/quinone reductase family protein [Streptomyces sp. MBT55]MBK6044242.1 nitroreductase family deazaflavin-dependent oxidoreductase [Streptomyces sp. MBT55]
MTKRRHGVQHNRPPPGGGRRRLARLCVVLFRMGLGPVLGRRLLLLHHTARTDGRLRHTALEVTAYDAERGSWILASPANAPWFLDLLAVPLTTVQVGNRHYAVTAHFPEADEAAEIMARHLSDGARRACLAGGAAENADARPHGWAGDLPALVCLDAAPGQRLP